MKLLCQDYRCSPGVVNKENRFGDTALMRAVTMGDMDIVKELDYFTMDSDGTTLIEMAMRLNRVEVLEYLNERPKVETLQVIVAHNIAGYMRNEADVEALEIPVTVRQFLAGFLSEDTYDDTDGEILDDILKQAGAELCQAQTSLG